MAEQPHNYEAAVRRYAETHHLPVGCVTNLGILHEDDCSLLVSGGRCDCNPEIKHMGTDGEPTEGPPNKLRPNSKVLWARVQRNRKR